MTEYGELIEQYKSQIKLHQKRISELKQGLSCYIGGHQNELYIRISILNLEIEDMWYSINMMKGYVKE